MPAGCSVVATVLTDGLCPVVSAVGKGVAGDVVASIANSFAAAADRSIQLLVTAWTDIPTPSVSGGTTSWLQAQLQPVLVFVGAFSIVAAMVRMVWTSRAEPAREMLAGLLRLVVISGAGLAGIDILLQAGDAFSSAILNAATPNGGNFGHLVVLGSAAIPESGLLVILALIAILASLIQIFLLIARGGLVVVLGGTWPLSAAASSTPAGNAWFKKTTAWLLAFILFKPVASIIYAAALRLTLSKTSGGLETVEGVMLLAMAVLALPALMRFAVPAVSAVGGISAGKAAAGAAVLATGAIATSGALGAGLARGSTATGGSRGGPPGGGQPPPGAAPTGGGSPPPGGPAPSGAGGTGPTTGTPAAQPAPNPAGTATQPLTGAAVATAHAAHGVVGAIPKTTGENQSS
jgi:hypothetical protein